MHRTHTWMALLATALLGGCAMVEQATRENEARQLAWTGPGPGPCLYGGVTPEAEEHCATLAWGAEGVLTVVSRKVRARLGPDAEPAAFVEAAAGLLEPHEGLRTERLYTCKRGVAVPEKCGVSLLVTDAGGDAYVLDSGAVMSLLLAPDGVLSFMAFEMFAPGRYAVGTPPVAAVAGSRHGATAAAR